MDILVLSATGEVGTAYRLQQERNNVRLFSNVPSSEKGVVKRVLQDGNLITDDMKVDEEILDRLLTVEPDLIVVDSPVFGAVREWPCPVVGVAPHALACQLDIAAEREVLKKCGVPLTGLPISLLCGFDGSEFVRPALACKVYSRFMPDDAGPDVGGVGAAAQEVSLQCRLVKRFLEPLAPFLEGYHGMVLVDGEQTRLLLGNGALALALISESLHRGLGDYLGMLVGMQSHLQETRGNWYGASALTIPPFPYAKCTPDVIAKPARRVLKHFWLARVSEYESAEDWLVGAETGIVGVSTAYADSLNEMRTRVIRSLRAIRVTDGQYRNDVGFGISSAMRALREEGWLHEQATDKAGVGAETQGARVGDLEPEDETESGEAEAAE